MDTLYITGNTGKIGKTSGRLTVEGIPDNPRREFRANELKRVVVIGSASISPASVSLLLREGVLLSFITEKGRLKGVLLPCPGKNSLIRYRQFRSFTDNSFCMESARATVYRKARNSLALLLQTGKNRPEKIGVNDIRRIKRKAEMIRDAESISGLRGLEGAFGAEYFRLFGASLTTYGFVSRSRMPARDPVNAMLNLGYGLLCSEVAASLSAHGLDPFIGYYHRIAYGRMALAFDIMEPYRPIIDRMVLKLLNRREFQKEDFTVSETDGVRFTEESIKRYLRKYDSAMSAQEHSSRTKIRKDCINLVKRIEK